MTSINYGPYTPTLLKVVSLGIGISDETNNTLNLLNTQALVVGERIQDIHGTSNQKTYGLIVDTQGIAINTTLQTRSLPYNNYAAYIDGDIRVTGNIYLDGSITCNLSLLNGSQSNNYWIMAPDDTYTNIYYNENITIGNRSAAMSNNYAVNIYQTANTDVEQIQFSLQNLQASQLRVGVIGEAYNSPIVFNTNSNSIKNSKGTSGGSIEFHMGRDQDYFSNIYIAPDGTTTGLPNYTSMPPPHVRIDSTGNVGINTSLNAPLTFDIRTKQNGVVNFTPITVPMSLNVNGSTYSKNMLIYDYESASVCNIDSLYVRKIGIALDANQIIPGTFAVGDDYIFPGNLDINNNLNVDNNANINNIIANNSLIDTASFCNDTLFNRDIIVNQSIRLRGQIFTEVFTGLSSDGTSNYGFEMIQFTPANVSYSNINVIGNGITTPGRLGVGINPSPSANNPVNTQFAIYKNNPKIWEISMFDKNDTLNGSTKAGYIGHPNVAETFSGGIDASLVIATPSFNDPNYSGNYSQLVQNIYFFPGIDMSSTAPPIVSGAVPPTLGIFNLPGNIINKAINAVGINTYTPLSELDVNGSITFSGNIYYNPTRNANNNIQLAIWKTEVFNANLVPGAPSIFYKGISYVPDSINDAHVGINIAPNYLYGLVVLGNTKFYNDIYKEDTNGVDRALGFWQDNRNSVNTVNNVSPASQTIAGGLITWGNVGIGTLYPSANFEVKDNYNNGTSLQISRGTGSSSNASISSFVFQGYTPYNSWTFQANHIYKYFQLGNGTSPFSNANNSRYMWMRPAPLTNNPQIVIGGNLNIFNSSNNPDINATLTVGGNMSVLGNVSISGKFIINGNTLVNSNIPGSVTEQLNDDDVLIGGGNIQLTPGNINESVIVGKASGIQVTQDVGKYFRVYNPLANTQPIIASFQGYNSSALIEIARLNNKTQTTTSLQFGLFDPTNSSYKGTQFAFLDGESQKPYMSFQPFGASIDNYVGFGIPLSQTPTSIAHIYTEGSGENMLKLTQGVFTTIDTTNNAPQIELQKNFESSSNNLSTLLQAPTSWIFKGPCSSWNNKMSFIYNTATYPGNPSFTNAITSKEVLTITNNGCVGIGSTEPTFALDIVNNGNVGSLRLLNSGANAAPQLVFQAGSNIYGIDASRDFRMVASNNCFTFDSKNPQQHYFIIDVDANNHIGIGQAANCNFDVSLNGIVNIGQSLYLNGNPLFSTGNLIQNGVTINGNNIFITPKTTYPSPNGGVVINGTTPTGNLFNIFSGNNANMLVLDSAYTQAQMYMRTSNQATGVQNMYRVATSNTTYLWQFYPNCYNSLQISDDNNGFQSVMSVAPTTRYVPPLSIPEFDFNITGSIVLNSFNNPGVYFGNMGYISGSNNNISLFTNNVNNGVGIGTYNPQSNFHVKGTSLFDGYTTFNYNTFMNGNLYVYGNSYVQGNQVTGVMTGNSSDKRLKKDLVKITDALIKIQSLTGYTYSLINEPPNEKDRRYTGLLAQEVQNILPEAILNYTPGNLSKNNNSDELTGTPESYLSIGYGNMMGLIVEAIKDLSIQITEIKEKLKSK